MTGNRNKPETNSKIMPSTPGRQGASQMPGAPGSAMPGSQQGTAQGMPSGAAQGRAQADYNLQGGALSCRSNNGWSGWASLGGCIDSITVAQNAP